MRTLIAGTMLLLSGCSLFHDELPTMACVDNNDCFVGQGEVCNLSTQVCEQGFDAGPRPDAPPVPDADMTPDADLPDADLTPDANLPDAT